MKSKAILAVAAVSILSLTACSGETPTPPMPKPSSSSAATPQSTITWNPCGEQLCGELTVPLDYSKPEGETVQIALLKVPARGEKKGSLVVNPGGPGASGIAYAAAADFIVTPAVRASYDIVGFDPRGIGKSAPVDCLSDKDLDVLLSGETTPDDAGEVAAMEEELEAFGRACQAKTGELLAHVSTQDVARDMDSLREALGEEKLTYMGKSYGTYLGDVYMRLFPARVGRFVLDGMYPVSLTPQETEEGQALGLEQATQAWAASCANSGCSLGKTKQAVVETLLKLLEGFDENPLKGSGGIEVTQAWARMGVAAALYDEARWPALTAALQEVQEKGTAMKLAELSFQYVDRGVSGTYRSNLMEAIIAVDCLDHGDARTAADFARWGEKLSEQAPVWGHFLAEGRHVCMTWPVKGESLPAAYSYKGAPVLVVGTIGDPATPMEWASRFVKETANSHLLTFKGEGHTAYKRTSPCIDAAVDAYLLDGVLPMGAATC